MLYRTLGKEKVKVSALGLGCMRLPSVDGLHTRNQPVDVDKAAVVIAEALDQGITYFDAAWPYHQMTSEAALGEGLARRGARKDVLAATKLPTSSFAKPESWEEIFSRQCANLQSDYLDVYLVHSLNEGNWKNFYGNGGLDFVNSLKREGKVRMVGFSFHDNLPLFKRIVDAYDWDVAQIQYNYMDVDFQAGREGLLYAAERGISMLIMESLKGGTLAREQPDEVKAVWGKTGRNWTPAEWALRWVLDQAEVAVALSGMGTAEEVRQNAAVASAHAPASLSLGELAAVAEARGIFRQLYKVGCTGCGYCMPCPAGIDIPEIFLLYNQHALFHDAYNTNLRYNMGARSGKMKADACVRCNACVKKCPQNIDVPARLAEAHAEMSALAERT